jgi:hypothetical protein
VSPFDPKVIAELLYENNVVALFSGDFELGPRALGHRSFIASPLSIEMKEIMNRKIKHREAYRPFAPIVLQSNFNKYFRSKHSNHDRMLYAVECTEMAQKKIPATVHFDNTARAQVVSDEGEQIVNIITEFEKLCGVGALINTSFNDNDEPIVLDEIDAISCFLRTNADVLVLNDVYIKREAFGSHEQVRAHLKRLGEVTNNRGRQLYARAINELLEEAPSRSLEDFRRESMITSEYIKNYSTISKLKSLLSDKRLETYHYIYTDVYHCKLLKFFYRLYRLDWGGISEKIIVLEDEYESLDQIRFDRHNLILLYNLSAAIRQAESVSPKTVDIFYDQADLIVPNNYDCNVQGYSALFDTYEIDATLSIDDFFNHKIT